MVPHKFQDFLFQFCEECLSRDCIKSVYCFRENGHLTILILPIHKHGRSSISSSVPFNSVIQLSVFRFFTSLVKVTPGYFIIFEVIVNGILFIISLSASSLFTYRNATD